MSEGWRRAGADDLAGNRPDTAETMWSAALEIIGIAGSEDPALFIHRHLKTAGQHDTALLSFVNKRDLARIGARLIAFLQDLQTTAKQIIADLAIGDLALADLDKLFCRIEGLLRLIRLEGEEFGEPDGNAIENALQCPNGWIGGVRFDQRYSGVCYTSALGQFPL